MILCLIVSVISVLPRVQEALPNSGLLQSSVVTLYTIYLTWSAVDNNPDRQCNHNFFGDADHSKVCLRSLMKQTRLPEFAFLFCRIRLLLTRPALLDWWFGWCAFCIARCDRRQRWPAFRILRNKVSKSVALFKYAC